MNSEIPAGFEHPAPRSEKSDTRNLQSGSEESGRHNRPEGLDHIHRLPSPWRKNETALMSPERAALHLHPAAVPRDREEADPLVADARATAGAPSLILPSRAPAQASEIAMEFNRSEPGTVVVDLNR